MLSSSADVLLGVGRLVARVVFVFAGVPFALYGIYLVGIITHELAHATAALLLGFDIASIQAGPFQWARSFRGFEWRSVSKPREFFGGLTGVRPDASTRALAARTAMIFAAGPIASLCIGLWTHAIANSLEDGILLGLVRLFSVANFVIVFLTAVPWASRRGMQSDGAHIVELLRGNPKRLLGLQLAAAHAARRTQRTLRGPIPDFDSLVRSTREAEPRPAALSVYILLLALDMDRLDVADEILSVAFDPAHEREHQPNAGTFVRTKAFLDALRERKAETLRAFIRLSRAQARPLEEFGLVDALLAFADGEEARAAQFLTEWKKHVANSRYPREVSADDWVVRALEKQLPAAASPLPGPAASGPISPLTA